MNSRPSPEWGRFLLLLTAATLLTLVPLPEAVRPYRPYWIMLVLFYLGTYFPQQNGVVRSWLFGLLVDGLTGSLLGTHGLTFAFTTYITLQFHLRLRLFAIIQQMLLFSLILALNLALEFLLRSATEGALLSPLFWLPLLTTPLLWPLFFLLREPPIQSPRRR